MQNQKEENDSSTVETTSVREESTVILVRSDEQDEKGGNNKVKSNLPEEEQQQQQEEGKHTYACVIHIKCNCDGEKVCRICHLSSEGPLQTIDLIQLGCGCKDELGIAHQHCGEAWFKLKGNRFCEICGEAAKNITGVEDNRFMEEWNERSDGNSGNSDIRSGFFQGQPLCNFLMACLVIAFVLPWFFRVNMF